MRKQSVKEKIRLLCNEIASKIKKSKSQAKSRTLLKKQVIENPPIHPQSPPPPSPLPPVSPSEVASVPSLLPCPPQDPPVEVPEKVEENQEVEKPELSEPKDEESTFECSNKDAENILEPEDAKTFDSVMETAGLKGWETVIKIINIYMEGIVGSHEAIELIQQILGEGEAFDRVQETVKCREANRRDTNWFWKKLNMKNLKEWDDGTVSYKKLPFDYPKSVWSGRTMLEEGRVLNDEYISVDSKFDQPVKLEPISKHEDTLFKIEDERYAIDYSIYINNLSIANVENYRQELIKNENNLSLWSLPKQTLNWIKKILHKNSKVLDIFSSNPLEAIPSILKSLNDNKILIESKKTKMIPIWRQETSKHWKLSLDCKGFNFQEMEKQNQNPKEFISSINYVMILRSKMKDIMKKPEIMNYIYNNDMNYWEELRKEFGAFNIEDIDDISLLEFWSKLPHYEMKFSDSECLKLTLKLVYIKLKSMGGTDRQLKFFISFCRYFFRYDFNVGKSCQLKEFYIHSDQLKWEKYFTNYILNKLEIIELKYLERNRQILYNENYPTLISYQILNSESTSSNTQVKGDWLYDQDSDTDPSFKSSQIHYPSLITKRDVSYSPHYPPLSPSTSLLFGNQNFYLILRYLHMTYSKLQSLLTNLSNPLPPPTSTAPPSSDLPLLCISLLLSPLSPTSFSTISHSLLSSQSYLLPSLQHSLKSLQKHIQLLVGSKPTQKLFAIFKIHSLSEESQYRNSVYCLLPSGGYRLTNDAGVVRVSVIGKGAEAKRERLKAGYLGKLVAEAPAAGNTEGAVRVGDGRRGMNVATGKVFLKRNLKKRDVMWRNGMDWEVGDGLRMRPVKGEDWICRKRLRDMSVGGEREGKRGEGKEEKDDEMENT